MLWPLGVVQTGEESYLFTADDGTIWRYDRAAGDYVQEQQQQQQDDEVIHCRQSFHLRITINSILACDGGPSRRAILVIVLPPLRLQHMTAPPPSDAVQYDRLIEGSRLIHFGL